MRPGSVHALLLLMVAAGCGKSGDERAAESDAGVEDASTPLDTNLPVEAATEDAGRVDTGVPDSGPIDAGAPDTGEIGDAALDQHDGTTGEDDGGSVEENEITGRWSETPPFGYVTAASDIYDYQGSEQRVATYSASFYATHPSPCTFQVVTSQCVFQHCEGTNVLTHANAGLIEFRVSDSREYLFGYNYTSNRYIIVNSSIVPWRMGGLLLEVEAFGYPEPWSYGNVPPFVASVPTPARVVITEPALDAQGDPERARLVVSRVSDLGVAWTGASDGAVKVTVSRQTTGVRDYAICRFNPQAGAAEVPAAILTQLPAGTGMLTFETASERIVEMDGWRILLAGTTDAVTPTSEFPFPEIDLQ